MCGCDQLKKGLQARTLHICFRAHFAHTRTRATANRKFDLRNSSFAKYLLQGTYQKRGIIVVNLTSIPLYVPHFTENLMSPCSFDITETNRKI